MLSNSNLRLRRVCKERWQNGCWDLPEKCHVKSELGVVFVMSQTCATLCFFCARTLAVSSSSVGSRPRTQSWCAVCVVTLTHHCNAVLASHWNQGMLCRRRALLETYQQKITLWSVMRVSCAFFGSWWNLQGEIFGQNTNELLHNCGPFQIFVCTLLYTMTFRKGAMCLARCRGDSDCATQCFAEYGCPRQDKPCAFRTFLGWTYASLT